MKTESEEPARGLEPELPGCSTGVLNADGNMVGAARMNDLRGLPEVHVEPPPQPLISEPIIVQRNAGGTCVLLMSSRQSCEGIGKTLIETLTNRLLGEKRTKGTDTAISNV